jgi:zinc protease
MADSAPLASRSFPGPETIRRTSLENGLVLLARENFSSPSVVISGYLEAGALDESPEQGGLADLTASALMRGTASRSFSQIYESIESIGASLSLGSGTHFLSFRGRALAEDLEVLLGLLADVLQNPVFPKDQVERLVGEQLTGLALRDQDTASVAQMAFDMLAYPEHPYRLPSDGYRETVARLTPSDLEAFHRRKIGPAGSVIAVVGAVPTGRAAEIAARHLGGWRNPSQEAQPELPPLRALTQAVRRDVPLAGKSQCDVLMGCPGPSRFDPGYVAASLGNNILGSFGLMGRIGDAVREQAGLAYYASSALGGGPGPGAWEVSAGVAPPNIERTIELITREIRRFVTRRVSAEELSDSQTSYIGRLPLQLESNDGVAGALLNIERYNLPLDHYQRYADVVRAITRDDVLEAARRFLDPDRLAIGVAGTFGSGA